jgi:titin
VQGNFIGTDLTGANGLQNGDTGIDIHDGASGVTVGGLADGARNIISGNFYRGIYFQSAASSNLVQGNYLGTDVTGSNRLGNGQDGILIADSGSTGNLIGGTVPTARNVISANGNQGVDIYNHANGNIVQGNFIGTDVSGTARLGNLSDGVLIEFAANNLIGGTGPGAGNLISGNTPNGLEIYASSASGNVVQGNLIGTDTSGTLALGNIAFGVNISSGASNTIGGTSTGARNIISGNGLSGVFIGNNSGDAAATGNKIQGNFLGTDITGTADLGNGEDGVFISGAVNNTIGGTSAAARNIISANGHFGRVNDGRSGIEIWDNASSNVVQGNFIGTDLTGTNGLGNREYGVFIQNSSRNTTGGVGDSSK